MISRKPARPACAAPALAVAALGTVALAAAALGTVALAAAALGTVRLAAGPSSPAGPTPGAAAPGSEGPLGQVSLDARETRAFETRAIAAHASVAGSAATFVLQTVPAIKNVRVTLDGTTRLTDAAGVAQIPTVSGAHHIDIRPPRTLRPGTGIQFSRWLDGLVPPSRKITLSPGINRDEVGFAISHSVTVRFTDAQGQPVPVSEVSRITISSSLGRRYTFPPADPPGTLTVNRIIRLGPSLHILNVRYSVREVLIQDSNVVYGGKENFFIGPHHRTWNVKVLLFPLRIEVRDAFFGFPIGTSVRLTMPNGASRIVALADSHDVVLTRLPRATYQLVPKGPGLGLSAPASLSKAQTAKLLLLSWVDVGSLAGFAVLFVLGLPLLGGRIVRRPGGRFLPTWHADRRAETFHLVPAAAVAGPAADTPPAEQSVASAASGQTADEPEASVATGGPPATGASAPDTEEWGES